MNEWMREAKNDEKEEKEEEETVRRVLNSAAFDEPVTMEGGSCTLKRKAPLPVQCYSARVDRPPTRGTRARFRCDQRRTHRKECATPPCEAAPQPMKSAS